MKERYRREIEDILSNIEVENDESSIQTSEKPEVSSDTESRSLSDAIKSIRPGKIVLSSLILLLVALLLGPSFPGFLGSLMVWGAVVIFIVGYSLIFIRPGQKYEKRWRGEPIDRPEIGFLERLRRKFTGF
jgi:hypothetical protein